MPLTRSKSSKPSRRAAPPRATTLRSTNVKFLLVSLLVMAVTAGSIYGIWRIQVSRTSGVFLDIASKHEQAGEWQQAVTSLNRYLQMHPDAGAQRIRMARDYVKFAKSAEQKSYATRLLYRALAADPGDEQVTLRRELCTLLLDLGMFVESANEASKILAISPKDADGLRIYALSLARQYQLGQLQREQTGSVRVIEALAAGLAANPGSIELATMLAAAYRTPELAAVELTHLSKKQILRQADALVDAMVNANTGDAKAYLSRFSYRTQFGIEGAKDDLEQALRLDPEDLATLATAASVAERNAERLRALDKDSPEAIEEYQNALGFLRRIGDLKLAAQDPGPTISIGRILVALGLKSEAEEVWQQGIREFPDQNLIFYTNLADQRLESRDFGDETARLLNTIDAEIDRRSRKLAVPARLMLQRDQYIRRGRWELGHGRAQQAISLLQESLTRQSQLGGDSEKSATSWLLLGAAYSAIGEHQNAGEAYDRAGALRPHAAAIHLAASESWLSANRPNLAVERAEHAVRIADTANAWFTLANACWNQQLRQTANSRAWKRFDQTIARAVEKADDGTLSKPYRAALLRAETLGITMAKSTPEQAAAYVRAAEKRFANSSEFWAGAALVYQKLGMTADADRAVAEMRKLPGAEITVTLVESQLLQASGKVEEAVKLLETARETASKDVASQLWPYLVKSKIAQQDMAAARSLLEEQLVEDPTNLAVLRQIADIDLQANKLEDVMRWEQRIRACGAQGELLAKYLQVRRMMVDPNSPSEKNLIEADALCEKLLASRPTWAEAFALRGVVALRRGKNDDAIRYYETAIALGDRRMAIYEQLLSLLYRANRLQDVEKYMAILKSSRQGELAVAGSQDFTVYESAVELRNDQIADAVATAQKGVEKRPQEAGARSWYGRMLLLNNQKAEAEREFTKAVELGPDQLQNWSNLFGFYVSDGNFARADEILQQMAGLPTIAEIDRPFILAQGYELMGERDKAAEYYDKAAEGAEKTPAVLIRKAIFHLKTKPDIARRCLEDALRIDPKSLAARQYLASLLAISGREEDWQRAEALLIADDAANASNSESQRLRAILLARKGGVDNLLRAEEIITALNTEPANQLAEDRLLLAQIYESLSKAADRKSESDPMLPHTSQEYLTLCREQFVTLCAQAEPQPQHLLAFIYHWQRFNRQEDTKQWMNRLESLITAHSKTSPLLVAEFIRLNIKEGNLEKADSLLEKLEATAPDSLSTVGLRARLLDVQGQKEEAEKLIIQKTGRLVRQAKNEHQRDMMRIGASLLFAMLDDIGNPDALLRELERQSPRAFATLSHSLARHGRFSDAIDMCEQLRRTDPSPNAAIIAASILGSYQVPSDQQERVEQLFDDAMKQFPENGRLLSVIGTYRITQGRHQEAIPLLRRAVSLEKRNAVALNNLAMLIAEDPQQRGEALRMVDEAIMLAGRVPALYDTKGTVLLLSDRPQEAIDFLREAVEEGEDDPRFRLHLARAYQKLNALPQARSELDQAMKRDLEKQVLTDSERQMLTELQAALAL